MEIFSHTKNKNLQKQSEFVTNRYRSPDQNLRTTFEKIIKRAGLVPWSRLFQNLRASRETELMAKHVASWIGDSVPVAMRHYAMATDESFQAAAGLTCDRGYISGHMPGYQEPGSSQHAKTEKAVSTQENDLLSVADDSCEPVLVGDEGLEPPTPSV